jgi:hypothetical protein
MCRWAAAAGHDDVSLMGGLLLYRRSPYRPDRYEYRLSMRRRGTGQHRRWQLVD